MPPNSMPFEQSTPVKTPEPAPNKLEIIWLNVFIHLFLNLSGMIGFYYYCTSASWATVIWLFITSVLSAQGITTGAHRLWSHRCYKAKLPFRIVLAICQTIAVQKSIYDWTRDHRLHHKYTDTDADPHNSQRGFFYCHIGWLMARKTELVKSKGRLIDMSDLEADPVVMFQKRHYLYLVLFWSIFVPMVVPMYFWNESLWNTWFICIMFRYCGSLHCTFFVNSIAHFYGTKPYDKNIIPTDNKFVSFCSSGEGYHNYHHTFPYDYKAAELSSAFFNYSARLIEFMHLLGQAYDLKSVPEELVRRRVTKTGDGSWTLVEQKTWGWGDKEMEKQEKEAVIAMYNIIN